MQKIPKIVWRNGWATYRFTIDHEVITTALHLQDHEAARAMASVLTKAIQLERARARLELAGLKTDIAGDVSVLSRYPELQARLAAFRVRTDFPTVGEVEAAFREDAKGREISPRVMDAYWTYLRKILRTVHGCDNFRANLLKVSALTPDLLHDYQAAMVAEAKPKGPAAIEGARTTSFSAINQVQSIFSVVALQGARMRALKLPSDLIAPFTSFRAEGTTKKIRVEVDDATIARLRAASDDLWFSAPARWLAFALAGGIGLRRGEAVMARWSWVRQIRGNFTMFLLTSDESTPKGNEHKKEIDPSLWADMCAIRQPGDYILPGDTREERDAALEENVAWLRDHGVDVNKPNHELRAIYLQVLDRKHGRAAAQRAGGHSSAGTTEIYTGRGTAPSARSF